MATWPATVPFLPLDSSVAIAPQPNVSEFVPDVGIPLRRRRYTVAHKVYQGELTVTDDQRTALDTFFTSDCEDGALSFSMRDWLNRLSSSTVTFHWLEPPNYARLGPNLWRVSLRLMKTA